MRLIITDSNFKKILIEHQGEESLQFDVSKFDWSGYKEGKAKAEENINDVFLEINQYWELQPPKIQLEIYQLYRKLWVEFTRYDRVPLMEANDIIGAIVEELIEYHPLNELEQFIKFKSNIIIPSNLEDKFEDDGTNTRTADKTYTRSDYIDLITLALALRTMIPVFGHYIFRYAQDTGNTLKEYWAYQLIANTEYGHSKAMNRLNQYINCNPQSKDGKNWHKIISEHLSSEDQPIWILAVVLIRRVTTGDIRGGGGGESKSRLITSIWGYLTQRMGNTDRSHENHYRDKLPSKDDESNSRNDDSRLAIIESYRTTNMLTDGDKATVIYYLSNPLKVARKVCPNIPEKMVMESLESVNRIHGAIYSCQIKLAGIALSKAISYRSIIDCCKEMAMLKNVVAIAQAIFWHTENYDLAVLVTANVAKDDLVIRSSSSSVKQIVRENDVRIREMFPHTRRQLRRTKIENPNQGIESINEIDQMFRGYDPRSKERRSEIAVNIEWSPTVPDHWLMEALGRVPKHFPLPDDLKTRISTAVIELA